MNYFAENADIKIVLAAVLIIYIILIFPLFLSINVYFGKGEQKLYFGFYLFGFVKILSGYGQALKDGYAVHLTDKKAVFTPYKNLFGIQNTVKPLKDYHIIKFNSLTEAGSKTGVIIPMATGLTVNFINVFATWLLLNKKPYMELKNDLDVYEDTDVFNIYAKAVVVLNVLMTIISLIKIILEKIINASRKRKQNKYSGGNRT